MRALIQRVTSASVTIDDAEVGRIGAGLVALLGVAEGDDESDARYLVDKIVNMRIFADAQGRFNRSALDVGGELLVVSQFTLHADTRRGRRPDFTAAADPETANRLYERAVADVPRNRPDRCHRRVPGLHASQPAKRRPGNHHGRQRRPRPAAPGLKQRHRPNLPRNYCSRRSGWLLKRTHFRKSSESGFTGFYDWTGLGSLHHGTVPILIIPKS